MKIECNVCEAALCWSCDQKVHAANKLASKHQRVALSNSNSHLPICDICQEAAGYFFCLEDRALLCRKCDVSIHTVNSLVSSHRRFLLTGVKVGLQVVDQSASNSSENITEAERSRSVPAKTVQMSAKTVQAGDFVASKMPPFTGSSDDSAQQWQFDEFLALTGFNQDYNCLANGSSKGGCGKLAELDGSPIVGAIDCLGQVPEMCSPPTSSGLYWSKTHPHHESRLGYDTFVPDVCYLATPKRRRDF